MAKAIFRLAKLKTQGSIGGSLAHSFRTRETPNADPGREWLNEFSHSTPGGLAEDLQARLPEKRRKDAVLALEYFMGASPEWFTHEQDGAQYFQDALAWLRRQHGQENVVGWAVHRDEKSPHLVAYVVPLDEKGKLNAKKFTGGKAVLSKMQTAFAAEVGHRHGLERGIEGSKAKHQKVQAFYGAISQEMTPKFPGVPRPPAPLKGLDKLSPPALQKRIDGLEKTIRGWESRGAALLEEVEVMRAKAKAYELAMAQKRDAERTAAAAIKRAGESDRLRAALTETRGKLAKTTADLQKAQEGLSEARQEVDQVKEHLGAAEKELAALRPREGSLKDRLLAGRKSEPKPQG